MTDTVLFNETLSSYMDGNDYSPALIGRAITTVRTGLAKNMVRSHAIGVAIMARAIAHKDCSLMKGLYEAMPKGVKLPLFKAWVHDNSNIRIVSDKHGVVKVGLLKAGSPQLKDDGALERGLMTATAIAWFDTVKPKAEPKVYSDDTFLTAMKALIKKYDDTMLANPANIAIIAAANVVVLKAAKAA